MKVFDCFCFFNELDLLELRLAELDPIVDYFVIVEGNKTHTGKSKDLIFDKNRSRYQKHLNKILYLPVTDLPEYDPSNILLLEQFQRNAIDRVLKNATTKEDKVLISDLDEIPNTELVRQNLHRPEPLFFQQDLFYYYVNNQVKQSCGGTVMANYSIFDTPQQQRAFGKRRYNSSSEKHPDIIPHGGWHYSYLSGDNIDSIINKIQNMGESDNLLHLAGTKEEILYKVRNQIDLFNRTKWRQEQEIVDISKNKPKNLDKFLQKYPQYFFRQK